VSTERPRGGFADEGVEERDGVFAAVAGEVAVMPVDHGQAGAHEAGEIEDRDVGAKREGRECVSQVVRPSQREAERQFGPKREEIVRGVGGTVRSADLYEAPIVEVNAGVRA